MTLMIVPIPTPSVAAVGIFLLATFFIIHLSKPMRHLYHPMLRRSRNANSWIVSLFSRQRDFMKEGKEFGSRG